MERLKEKISREDLFKLEMLAQERRFQSLTETLLQIHYDKVYQKSINRYNSLIIQEFDRDKHLSTALKYIKDYVSGLKYDKVG